MNDHYESIDVIVEVPYLSNMKYEIDNDLKRIRLDRILNSSMVYPGNYGYIENTLAEDGDPLDVLLLSNYSLIPGCVIKSRVIGALIMRDEKGLDEKVIAVPDSKVDATYADINNIDELPKNILDKIKHFFEYYKKIDKGKWSEVDGFIDKDETFDLITKYSDKYESKYNNENNIFINENN